MWRSRRGCEGCEDRADLDGQFARRDQDECLDRVHLGIGSVDDGHDEGERLARPGAGLADDILAIQEHWHRSSLNGRWVDESLRREEGAAEWVEDQSGRTTSPRVCVVIQWVLTPWAGGVGMPRYEKQGWAGFGRERIA